MGITHSTPADGTFSGTGSTAWNAEHTLSESGGQALTVGSIANGEFVKRSGTALIGATPSGNSDIFAADSPNTDFDLTNGGLGGAVTILSKSITGIAAGDRIEIDLTYTILNNSGSSRAISISMSLGTLTLAPGSTSVNASATSRAFFTGSPMRVAISSTSLAYAVGAATTINSGTPVASGTNWHTVTDDLTGSQTFTFAASSNNTTTAQTLTLHGYTIRKISSNP